jgi:hypothetical protein
LLKRQERFLGAGWCMPCLAHLNWPQPWWQVRCRCSPPWALRSGSLQP